MRARDVRCPKCGAELDPMNIGPDFDFDAPFSGLIDVRWVRTFALCLNKHSVTITVERQVKTLLSTTIDAV